VKNLMVTGGAGFIGANLIHYILEESDFPGKVVNVDKLTYAGNLASLAGLEEKFPGRYVFSQTDILDAETLEKLLLNHEIDTICHLAAESHVDRSIAAPEDFIQTNIVGTFRLLELARKHSDRIRRFHHVSTD